MKVSDYLKGCHDRLHGKGLRHGAGMLWVAERQQRLSGLAMPAISGRAIGERGMTCAVTSVCLGIAAPQIIINRPSAMMRGEIGPRNARRIRMSGDFSKGRRERH